MGKKYKIVGIGPEDAWCDDADVLVGQVGEGNIEPSFFGDGYSVDFTFDTPVTVDDGTGDMGPHKTAAFLDVLLEEVVDNG